MIDYQNIFHTGILVPDIEVAMQEMGESLRLKWVTPWRYEPMRHWTPRGMAEATLLITYSKQGPQHVELIQGTGFWASSETRGVHHIGVWSDNLMEDAAALITQGWEPMAASASSEEAWGRFCYLRPPSGGMLLELVSSVIKPLMEERWAQP